MSLREPGAQIDSRLPSSCFTVCREALTRLRPEPGLDGPPAARWPSITDFQSANSQSWLSSNQCSKRHRCSSPKRRRAPVLCWERTRLLFSRHRPAAASPEPNSIPIPATPQDRPLPAQVPIRAGAARNRAHPMATRRPSQPSPPSYPRSIPIRPSPPTYPLQPDLSFPFPMPTPHSAPAPEPASRAELRSRPTANACASESEHTQIARFPLPVLPPLPVLRGQSSPAKCRCGSLTVFASGIGKEIASDGLTVKSSTAR